MAKSAAKKAASAAAQEISQTNAPRNEVVTSLQRQVANAFVLYANYKHYHWQTYGPLFRDLHLLFDEFAGAVLETIDEMAERIRMIGQNPVARLEDIIKTASIKSAAAEQTMRGMIKEGDDNLNLVILEMREAIKTANEQDDPGTADVLTRFVQIHEKQEWWLRDLLAKHDGLTA